MKLSIISKITENKLTLVVLFGALFIFAMAMQTALPALSSLLLALGSFFADCNIMIFKSKDNNPGLQSKFVVMGRILQALGGIGLVWAGLRLAI